MQYSLLIRVEKVHIYANPSKFYIPSLGFPDIEMKQGFFFFFLQEYKNVMLLY